MRVAVYARVSTEQQARTQTIETQVERLREYTRQQGWELAEQHLFRDEGCSGSTLDRPGLRALRQAALRGEVDLILLTTPDRLARQYVHQVLLLEELEGAGCTVQFLDQPWSKEPSAQLMLQICGAVAQFERSQIMQRTQMGKQRKFDAGILLPWSSPPYGLRVNPDRPSDPQGVTFADAEAAVVGEMFARYLAPGGTVAGVLRWLADASIASPAGNPQWQPASVRAVLVNPAYAGLVYTGRFQLREARQRQSPLKGVIGSGKSHRAQPPEHWKLVTRIPALISEEDFERVQAKLARNALLASRNNKAHTYLLRALVSCGDCQGACGCRTTQSGHSYYECRNRRNPVLRVRGETCRASSVRVGALDALVWGDLCEVLTHPDSITEALERAHGGHWVPQELQARRSMLRRAKESSERQLARLTEAYLGEVVGLDEYRRRRKELEGRIAVLEQQERQLVSEGERHLELRGVAVSIEAFCQRVRQGLSEATAEQKRRLVELLVDRVVVTGEEVEIRYVVPTTPGSENIRFCHLRTHFSGGPSAEGPLAATSVAGSQTLAPKLTPVLG